MPPELRCAEALLVRLLVLLPGPVDALPVHRLLVDASSLDPFRVALEDAEVDSHSRFQAWAARPDVQRHVVG